MTPRQRTLIGLTLPRHSAAIGDLTGEQVSEWIAQNGDRFSASQLREYAGNAEQWEGIEFDDSRVRYKTGKSHRWAIQIASAMEEGHR